MITTFEGGQIFIVVFMHEFVLISKKNIRLIKEESKNDIIGVLDKNDVIKKFLVCSRK